MILATSYQQEGTVPETGSIGHVAYREYVDYF